MAVHVLLNGLALVHGQLEILTLLVPNPAGPSQGLPLQGEIALENLLCK